MSIMGVDGAQPEREGYEILVERVEAQQKLSGRLPSVNQPRLSERYWLADILPVGNRTEGHDHLWVRQKC
jgi:hypothetical protein